MKKLTPQKNFRSGEKVKHTDGRIGIAVRPAGVRKIVVRWTSGQDEVIDANDLTTVGNHR